MDGPTGSTNMCNRHLPARINVGHTALMAKSPLFTMLDYALECLLGITAALVSQSVECIIHPIDQQCHAHHVAGILKCIRVEEPNVKCQPVRI